MSRESKNTKLLVSKCALRPKYINLGVLDFSTFQHVMARTCVVNTWWQTKPPCYVCLKWTCSPCVPHRFTELYVEELENDRDLRILVSDYLKGLNPHRSVINGIIRLGRQSYVTAGINCEIGHTNLAIEALCIWEFDSSISAFQCYKSLQSLAIVRGKTCF